MAIYDHCLLPFLCALLRRDCLLYNAHIDNEKKKCNYVPAVAFSASG